MSRKGLYLAVGFVWSTVISLGVALAVSAIAAGAAWIYLFGDDTWPDWANWAILGAGGVAWLLSFAICMLVARTVANRYDEPADEQHAGQRGSGFAWLLLLAGLAAAGGFAWWEYGRETEVVAARDRADQAAGYFAVLDSRTHRISGITVDWPGGGGDGSAQITLDGQRDGQYRLDWQVRDGGHEKPLQEGIQTLQLAPGVRQIDIPLSAERIVEGYRELLSRQDANVMVDEAFLLETILSPIPDDEELSRMPAHETQNLNNGQSALIDRSSAEFTVRFFLNGGTLSWK